MHKRQGGTVHAFFRVMAGVRDVTELDVYRLSEQLYESIVELLKHPGFRRDPDLRGQLKRAAESPCPNLAEGFSRFYPRENARFVRVAKSSLSEVLVHLERAVRRELVTPRDIAESASLARRARGAATAYLRYLENTPDFQPPARRKIPKRRTRTAEPGNPEPRNDYRNGATPEPDPDTNR